MIAIAESRAAHEVLLNDQHDLPDKWNFLSIQPDNNYLVTDHFGLKVTRVYYYTKLTQLDERWLDKFASGEITIKTAMHSSKLSAQQPPREFLCDWSNITQKQILSIDVTYPEEDMRRALTQADTRMRKLRVWVSEERYAELDEIVNVWLSEYPIALKCTGEVMGVNK